MAESKIVQEAFLDVKKIKEALDANTKEILRSVAREEIDGVVKESLEESGYEEEDAADKGPDENPSVGDQIPDAGTPTGEPEAVAGPETDSVDSPEIPASDEVDPTDQGIGMDADPALGGDELDMTGASDDDVIAIYKKLSGEDEIQVVGDELHIKISEPGEYIVKQGGGLPNEAPIGDEVGGLGDELGGPEMGDEAGDDPTYEIDMDDDSEGDAGAPAIGDEAGAEPEASPEGTDDSDKDENLDESDSKEADKIEEEDKEDDDVVEESIPVGIAQAHRLPGKANIGQPRGAGAKDFPTTESTASKKPIVSEAEVKYKKMLTEVTALKSQNNEFREALKKYRSMLVETVVFNSNLSYVTKLFMENSTTKDEKIKIIQRFDEEVTNLKESKRLYKTIVDELSARKPINETIENKITKEVTTGSSNKLTEATVYVDPELKRFRELLK